MDVEKKKHRLIDLLLKLIYKSKIIIAIVLFFIILFLLSDFFTNHVLMPMHLADLNGPTSKGYAVIAGTLSLLYMIIDLIYQQYAS